jgi:tetratricopeptide (TPR) repeat protein
LGIVIATVLAVAACGPQGGAVSPPAAPLAQGARHAQGAAPPAAQALRAPLVEGIGETAFAITTSVPMARRFFRQGLLLAWAFDHAEAARSFREAVRLDPGCAMCEWGLAYVTGPNVNRPYRDRLAEASGHARRAVELAAAATPREQALTRALAERYGVDVGVPAAVPVTVSPPAEGGAICSARALAGTDPLDLAYARAMARVAAEFPEDADVAVLYAEALLMLSPWEWWGDDGVAGNGVPEAVAVLERVLQRTPGHVGANHYLIHALEQSPEPGRALPAAERLGSLAPSAGHLVHMPAHVYVRVGRYADASRANEAAIAGDAALFAQMRAAGFEPVGQTSHHHHFLWASAGMEGRGAAAIEAASDLAARAAGPGEPFGPGTNDYFLALPLLAQVRFARWEAILATPELRGASPYPGGVWHYARGVAFARTGDIAAARAELAALERAAAAPALRELEVKGIDPLAALLGVAVESLRGETALAAGRRGEALARLRAAVALEDALEAEEPPLWAASTRIALGGALLASGRPREAAAVFREDLARHPDNGWALYGLAESLQRQGLRNEAAKAATAYRTAWARADVGRPDARY